MSEKFKRGDRVLVEGKFLERGSCGTPYVEVLVPIGRGLSYPVRECYPHPGVPVADLLEELEAADAIINGPKAPLAVQSLYSRLRDARLAASKPKEVWVRAERVRNGQVKIRSDDKAQITSRTFTPHPDDIKEG